jgi:hypothetical protein
MSYAGLEQLQYIAGVGPGAKDRGRPTFAKLCRETQVLAHCAGRCASNSPKGQTHLSLEDERKAIDQSWFKKREEIARLARELASD